MKALVLITVALLSTSCVSASPQLDPAPTEEIRLGSEWAVALPLGAKKLETGGAQLGIAQYALPGFSFSFRVNQNGRGETPASLLAFFKANIRGAANVSEGAHGSSPSLYWYFEPTSVEGVLLEAHGRVFGPSSHIEYFGWVSDAQAEKQAEEVFRAIRQWR